VVFGATASVICGSLSIYTYAWLTEFDFKIGVGARFVFVMAATWAFVIAESFHIPVAEAVKTSNPAYTDTVFSQSILTACFAFLYGVYQLTDTYLMVFKQFHDMKP